MSDTLTRPTTDQESLVNFITSDQPEDSAHIVLVTPEQKAEGKTAQSIVLESRIFGTPVTALCGHTWVPSKDPKNLPLCSKCKEIYEYDPQGHGDRDQLPDA